MTILVFYDVFDNTCCLLCSRLQNDKDFILAKSLRNQILCLTLQPKTILPALIMTIHATYLRQFTAPAPGEAIMGMMMSMCSRRSRV